MYKYLILFLLSGAILFAQDVEEIIEEMQERYTDMEDMSATFKKVDRFKLTGSVSETKGKIYIKEGEKYRFESEDQVIVTDGKSVWSYNAITNKLIIDKVRKNSGAFLPRDMLFKYPKEFYSTLLKEEEIEGENHFIVRMDPRGNKHGFVKSMKVWIEEDAWLIKKIEVTDLNDNISMYVISNLKVDQKLKDTFFSYQATEGVKVIDVR